MLRQIDLRHADAELVGYLLRRETVQGREAERLPRRGRHTFADPHQLSTGVRDVWVNGARVVRDGAHTGATPGRIVAGPGRR